MVKNLPVICSISEIDIFTFSTYKKICKCILYGLPKSSVELQGSLGSPGFSTGILLGILYHDLLQKLDDLSGMERESASGELKTYLEEYIDKIERRYRKHLGNSGNSFMLKKQVGEIYLSVWDKYLEQERSSGNYLREEKIILENESLMGIVDEIYFENGKIRLIDFKTTSKLDRLTSQDNLDQIHFYAYLINRKFNQYPDEIRLQGISEASTEIEVDKSYSEMIAKEMVNKRNFVNQKINNFLSIEELCIPDTEWCIYCRYRMICPSIIHRITKYLLPHDKEVLQVNETKIERNNEGIAVHGVSGGGCIKKGKEVVVPITRLEAEEIGAIESKDSLTLSNVNFTSSSNQIRCSDDTEFFIGAASDE